MCTYEKMKGAGWQGDVAEDGSSFKILPQYLPRSCIQWYQAPTTVIHPDAMA
jgi:hypothetical protein